MLATTNTINNAVWTSSRIVNNRYVNWVRISAETEQLNEGTVIFRVLVPAVDTEKLGVNEVIKYIEKLGVSEYTKKSCRLPIWIEQYQRWFYETKIFVSFY